MKFLVWWSLRRRYFRRMLPGIMGCNVTAVLFILFLLRRSYRNHDEDELSRLARIQQAVETLQQEHILEDSKNFTLYQAVRYFTVNHNLTERTLLNRGLIRLDAVKLALEVMEGHRFDVKLRDMHSALNVLQTRPFPRQQRQERCNNCNDFSQEFIINPEQVCQGEDDIDLLILVTTVPGSVKERSTIRGTWGMYTAENTGAVRIMFLYGTGWSREEEKTIIRESLHFHDTLQYNHPDSYYNLPYKVINGYKWALRHCQRAKFILRTADDNYVNVPELLSWIRSDGLDPKFSDGQIGHVLSREDRQVYRLRDQKWYITKEEYDRDVFPPFAVGTGFLLSMTSAGRVVNAASDVPLFPLEDVWLGLIMEQIKMPVYDVRGFDLPLKSDVFVRREFTRGLCPYGGKFYTVHETMTDDIIKLWTRCRLKDMV